MKRKRDLSVTVREEGSATRQALRTTGLVLIAIGAVAGLAALVVRDQISRHRRELFSPHPLRRLAALGYIAKDAPSVDNVRLLRDFITWESRGLLRRQAAQILARVERRLQESAVSSEVAG